MTPVGTQPGTPDGSLDATSAALTDALQVKCPPTSTTWTDAAGSAAIGDLAAGAGAAAVTESLPINCINWFEAEAFCIWDGGRLPTDAEWNYAAAGGTQQRIYPWGSAAPDCSYANFVVDDKFSIHCVAPGFGRVNRVGSDSPKGDGLYGQADLAGNVAEWVQDSYATYINPCNNCANTAVDSDRVLRGGGFIDPASKLLSSDRTSSTLRWDVHVSYFGARCARSK